MPAPEDPTVALAPQEISDLAGACRRFVAQALGAELDGTQDTLPLLDHYLSQVGEVSSEVVTLVAPAAGAYFGEVVRAHLEEGTWSGFREVTEDLTRLELGLLGGTLILRPAQAALEAVASATPGGAAPVLRATGELRAVVDDALAGFGDVREDDFYRLSVRFDALLQAHAHAGAHLRRKTLN